MIPTTMQAVCLTRHGDVDALEYRTDMPVPAPGPGDVLIAVGAAGVNNTDINTRIGWYSKTVTEGTEREVPESAAEDGGWAGSFTFPRIQGADGCGRIVAVGPGAPGTRIGERVLIDPILRGGRGQPEGYFGSECDGAFAGYTRVPAANAYAIHSPLTDAELASFPCSYSAAENMIGRAGVGAGETVLVTGASGGVGSAAVQLARRRGARVIGVANLSKAPLIQALGAERVLARDADLTRELGQESVDVVIDVVGGAQFPSLLKVLRRRGRYAVAGAISGPVVELDLRTLYLKDLRLLGCTILDPKVFGHLIGYIERDEIRPLVSQVYPLKDIAAAQAAFLSKQHVGKIVLSI